MCRETADFAHPNAAVRPMSRRHEVRQRPPALWASGALRNKQVGRVRSDVHAVAPPEGSRRIPDGPRLFEHRFARILKAASSATVAQRRRSDDTAGKQGDTDTVGHARALEISIHPTISPEHAIHRSTRRTSHPPVPYPSSNRPPTPLNPIQPDNTPAAGHKPHDFARGLCPRRGFHRIRPWGGHNE